MSDTVMEVVVEQLSRQKEEYERFGSTDRRERKTRQLKDSKKDSKKDSVQPSTHAPTSSPSILLQADDKRPKTSKKSKKSSAPKTPSPTYSPTPCLATSPTIDVNIVVAVANERSSDSVTHALKESFHSLLLVPTEIFLYPADIQCSEAEGFENVPSTERCLRIRVSICISPLQNYLEQDLKDILNKLNMGPDDNEHLSSPSQNPTSSPSRIPTEQPTGFPTTEQPTGFPFENAQESDFPTLVREAPTPSVARTQTPTIMQSLYPSDGPSLISAQPSAADVSTTELKRYGIDTASATNHRHFVHAEENGAIDEGFDARTSHLEARIDELIGELREQRRQYSELREELQNATSERKQEAKEQLAAVEMYCKNPAHQDSIDNGILIEKLQQIQSIQETLLEQISSQIGSDFVNESTQFEGNNTYGLRRPLSTHSDQSAPSEIQFLFDPPTESPSNSIVLTPININPSSNPSAFNGELSTFPSTAPTKTPTSNFLAFTPVNVNLNSVPSSDPTDSPTEEPSAFPSTAPTNTPTSNFLDFKPVDVHLTSMPSSDPTDSPTEAPSAFPSKVPTNAPTSDFLDFTPVDVHPSSTSSSDPTDSSTEVPTIYPSTVPTNAPTSDFLALTPIAIHRGNFPTHIPAESGTPVATDSPSAIPSTEGPSSLPTDWPSLNPQGWSPLSRVAHSDLDLTPVNLSSTPIPSSLPTKSPSPTESPSVREPSVEPPSSLPTDWPSLNPQAWSPLSYLHTASIPMTSEIDVRV